MKLPFRRYAKTLLLFEPSVESTTNKLRSQGLFCNVNNIKALMSEETLENFLILEGTDQLYCYLAKKPSLGIDCLFKLLDEPKVRNVLMSLFLAGIDVDEIGLILDHAYDKIINLDDLINFQRLFFDVTDFTYAEKDAYIKSIRGDSALKMLLRSALKEDKDIFLWKVGSNSGISIEEMFTNMFRDCFYNFKENSKHSPDMAQKWGGLAVKIGDRLQRIQKDTDDKKDAFDDLDFEVKQIKSNDIKSLEEL